MKNSWADVVELMYIISEYSSVLFKNTLISSDWFEHDSFISGIIHMPVQFSGSLLCLCFQGAIHNGCVCHKSQLMMMTMTMMMTMKQRDSWPASTMAALLLGQTDSTLRTLDVVHSNFSYVVDFMIRTSSTGPPLAMMISYNNNNNSSSSTSLLATIISCNNYNCSNNSSSSICCCCNSIRSRGSSDHTHEAVLYCCYYQYKIILYSENHVRKTWFTFLHRQCST